MTAEKQATLEDAIELVGKLKEIALLLEPHEQVELHVVGSKAFEGSIRALPHENQLDLFTRTLKETQTLEAFLSVYYQNALPDVQNAFLFQNYLARDVEALKREAPEREKLEAEMSADQDTAGAISQWWMNPNTFESRVRKWMESLPNPVGRCEGAARDAFGGLSEEAKLSFLVWAIAESLGNEALKFGNYPDIDAIKWLTEFAFKRMGVIMEGFVRALVMLGDAGEAIVSTPQEENELDAHMKELITSIFGPLFNLPMLPAGSPPDSFRLHITLFGGLGDVRVKFNRAMMAVMLEDLAKAEPCIKANNSGERIEHAAIRASGVDGSVIAQKVYLTPVCLSPGMTMERYEEMPMHEQANYWASNRVAEMSKDAPAPLKMELADVSEKVWDMEAYLFEYLQNSLVAFIARIFDLAQLHAIEGSKIPEKLLKQKSKLAPLGFSVKVQRRPRSTSGDQKKDFYKEYMRVVKVFRDVNSLCFIQRGPRGKEGSLTDEAWLICNEAKLDRDLVGKLATKQPGYLAILQAGRKTFAGTDREGDFDFLKELKEKCELEVAKGQLKLNE